MRAATAVFLLSACCLSNAAIAASCPGAPAGVRAGAGFQIHSGASAQVSRIRKGEPLRGCDGDPETRRDCRFIVRA